MKISDKNSGFTLIELLIAIAISSIVLAAIYSAYQAQLKSHITQQKVVEMQQNARAAMYVMEREIKMAGYDPDGSQSAGITVATDNTITFTISANADGIDNDGDGDTDADDDDGGEVNTITYALVGQDLQRTAGGTTNTVAENIEVLDFFYFEKDVDGNVVPLPPPVAAGDLENIRSVQITIIARSGANVPALMMKHTDHKTYTNQQGNILLADPDDNFRRIVLTADVKCRNAGFD